MIFFIYLYLKNIEIYIGLINVNTKQKYSLRQNLLRSRLNEN